MYGYQKGIPETAERWSVGQVQLGDVVDPHAGGNGGGRHIDAARGVAISDTLGSDQATRTAIDEDLDP
jgi:hypothetical protein